MEQCARSKRPPKFEVNVTQSWLRAPAALVAIRAESPDEGSGWINVRHNSHALDDGNDAEAADPELDRRADEPVWAFRRRSAGSVFARRPHRLHQRLAPKALSDRGQPASHRAHPGARQGQRTPINQ